MKKLAAISLVTVMSTTATVAVAEVITSDSDRALSSSVASDAVAAGADSDSRSRRTSDLDTADAADGHEAVFVSSSGVPRPALADAVADGAAIHSRGIVATVTEPGTIVLLGLGVLGLGLARRRSAMASKQAQKND